MRNLNQATLYPGIGAIEYSNISVGRGTDQPFEQFGAPWIDGRGWRRRSTRASFPGIRFYPVTFTPTSSKYAGEVCQGVFMVVTNRTALQPVRVGTRDRERVVCALWRRSTTRATCGGSSVSGDAIVARIRQGEDPPCVSHPARARTKRRWRRLRAKYLLYR